MPTTIPVLCFHGTGSYVSLGKDPAHRVQRDITIEAWVKITRSTKWAGVISRIFHTYDVQSGYGMMLDGGTGLYFVLKHDAGEIVYLHTGPGVISVGAWHHVAMTWDGARMVVYVDGADVARQNAPGQAIDYDPDNDLALGHMHDNNEDRPFEGRLAEVRVWKVARTREQIAEAMYDRLPARQSDLVSCWPLSEGGGSTVTDLCGSVAPAMVTGTSWAEDVLPERPAAGPTEHPIIQSGRVEAGKSPWLETGSGVREVSGAVAFPKPFARTPNVVVGLDLIDIGDGHDTRVQVRAEGVCPEGFMLVVGTWGDTSLKMVGATWVASVPAVDDGAGS